VAFWRACTPVLADVVPHYMTPCCYTLDRSSLKAAHRSIRFVRNSGARYSNERS
jgi:hypothetical protein